ncbi:MAG TPA: GGDEF domain-containing protein [Sphaerochaeta sp.]|nr:GGDEF domain-containing protein [Sphaerochaeta sp.]
MDTASFPEQWLQVFAKFSLDFFVVELGVRNKVLYSGGKKTSYFGYPVEVFVDLIEGFFGDLVLESDKARVGKALHEAKEMQSDFDQQFHVFCFDRSVSQVHLTGSYLYSREGVPVFLFLVEDKKEDTSARDTKRENFRLSFSVDTGSLLEVNLQGRIAFLVHEFTNIYEAITIFASRYVHPQDRKAFAIFADQKSLASSVTHIREQKEIPFRRTSYNELFSGYQWALLSYSFEESGEGSSPVCELHIQDSDTVSSRLAEKILQTQLDPLTGVVNRTALEMQVNQQIALCAKQESIGAFFMLDIDQFKGVNDTFGHDRGDEVLRAVANAVKGVFRPTDIVARPGGDEFAVFITGIPSPELAIAKAENICTSLRNLKTVDEDLSLTCSVGISLFPNHGTSFKELYHTSDLALYQAKREGKDRYCLFGTDTAPQGKEKPVDRQWIFSQMEEEMYLCNVDTYELLFVNEALLKRLGLTMHTARGFCYEVLHGRTKPCDECRNLFMEKGQLSTRIRKYPESTTMYLLREKALLLKGERVKLSISTPIPTTWREFLEEHVDSDTLKSLPCW